MTHHDTFIQKLIEGCIIENWKILQIYENGWINVNSSLYTSLKVNEVIGLGDQQWITKDLVPLNMEHIRGAIFVLILGYVISLIIFLIEVLLKHYM